MTTKTKTPMTDELFETDELVALARLDVEKGNIDQALARIKQALADATPPAEALTLGARLYAQLGLFERAQVLYQRFLKSNPGAVIESFQLGMTHLDAGQPQEALAIWDALLKDHPVHPPALFYKALALSQQGQPVDARHALETLLKSAPADNLYFGRGKELLQTLDTGAAPGATIASPNKAPRGLPQKDAYKIEH